MADLEPLDAWEALWAPYDETTYAAAVAAIKPADIVLDIGAGDLRFARRIAERASKVVAWEIQPDLLATASQPLPANLFVDVADARTAPIPAGVTAAVLLMRHCTHYALYVEKLRAAGCGRLITNARWGMGVEVIDLTPGVPFDSVGSGWYACRRCGKVGFAGDNAQGIDAASLEQVADAEGCPFCTSELAGATSPKATGWIPACAGMKGEQASSAADDTDCTDRPDTVWDNP